MKYTGNFLHGSLPRMQRAKVTVGFRWPPVEDEERYFWNDAEGRENYRTSKEAIYFNN